MRRRVRTGLGHRIDTEPRRDGAPARCARCCGGALEPAPGPRPLRL